MFDDTLVSEFLEYTRDIRGCQATTVEAYRVDLRVFASYVSKQGTAEITPLFLMGFIRHLRVERHNAQTTINRKLATLGAYFDYLLLTEHMTEQQDPRGRMPKMAREPDHLPSVLSEDEVRRLLAQPRTDTILGLRDRAILTLLYSTGMRVGELCGLRLQDVSWSEQTILVTGKGNKQRYVPLHPAAKEAVEAYLKCRPSADVDSLFVSKKRGSLTPRALQYLVQSYATGAGLERRVTPHTLRHCCATHLLKAGNGIEVIRKLLGHASIATTQIYLRITIQDLKEMVQAHPVRRMLVRLQIAASQILPYQGSYHARAG